MKDLHSLFGINTKVGSMVFDIKVNDESEVHENSLQHKIFLRLTENINLLYNAKNPDVFNKITNSIDYLGLTSDICDAFCKLKYDDTSDTVDIKISYNIKNDKKIHEITLSEQDFITIEGISNHIKNITDNKQNAILIGNVVSLFMKPDGKDKTNYEYSIGVSGFIYNIDSKNQHYKVSTSYEQYLDAFNSQKEKAQIKIIGDINKASGKWEFVNAKELSLYNLSGEQLNM